MNKKEERQVVRIVEGRSQKSGMAIRLQDDGSTVHQIFQLPTFQLGFGFVAASV